MEQFKSILKSKKIDIALFFSLDYMNYNPNMVYFCGYKGLGALAIPKSKAPFLIVPRMEVQRAKKSGIKVYSMEKKRFFEELKKVIKKPKTVGIEKRTITLSSYKHFKKQFKKIRIKDISEACHIIRQIKTEKEINFLKKSCHEADKILQKTIKKFKTFKTESEAAAFLEYETKKQGLELSFNPIVASGSNGSMPHHEPANVKIKKGFCVIDFGVKYKGYCSDITRTIYVGKPTKKEVNTYNFLLEIQKDTINQVKQNKKCSELYDFVNTSLGKDKKYFTHGLGHGVGVEIHELPNLTLNSKDRIKNNMVFTIEPGLYFPKKFGIRIEDTVLFKNKPILLTKTTKDLLIV